MLSLKIPDEFIQLCTEWHSGQSSMMYAVSSTGALSLGTIKPLDCETDEEWFQSILSGLESEVRDCIRILKKSRYGYDLDEVENMERFLGFLEGVVWCN